MNGFKVYQSKSSDIQCLEQKTSISYTFCRRDPLLEIASNWFDIGVHYLNIVNDRK